MKIAVVGTGYVGLVTGTCLAEMGNEVTCIDIDQAKVDAMKKGEIPIYEPGLETIFERNIGNKRLTFTTNLAEGIEGSQCIFLALPTPPGEDGSADLSYILGVADALGPLLKEYTVIIDKSTVPVGTADLVRERVAKNATSAFDIVSNPEFLREGFAVNDFLKPDRIVIGTSSDKASKIMDALYAPFVSQGSAFLVMDERSAEMTKYAANSFLALKISFMNEIANLSEILGANVDAVREGIGSDERIGKRFLYPGIGYGGSCFPKDVLALHQTAAQHGYDFRLLDIVTKVNEDQKKVLASKIIKYFKNDIKGKTFALWGLAFKPDTDDIREAPALTIIKILTEKGASIVAYDPEATENVTKVLQGQSSVTFAKSANDALKDVDALIIATEWNEFREPDFAAMKKAMKAAVIFDGRNLYGPQAMKTTDFHYESIGREVIN
ncbi:MAG: UDP-glucose/GDP-mannose dehydrogenase family protein [Candidatus Saccharibacteria bacterium]|nr:UDP-glucose/GDP-mannose dehydrogenase family protein [Candidatus Saccharibacteria bacterium]